MHYYGCIYGEFQRIVPKPKYGLDFTREAHEVDNGKEGNEWTSRFESKKETIKHAVKTFQNLKLKGILRIGNSSTCQPQRILICPKLVLDKAKRENQLWREMEKYYRLEGDDPWPKYGKRMEEINKEWADLWGLKFT